MSIDTVNENLFIAPLEPESNGQPLELYGGSTPEQRTNPAHPRNAYYTPQWLVKVIRKDIFGGIIDLDPATDASNPVGALTWYTQEDDGLAQPWFGNVFCNPPYGKGAKLFAVHAVNETLAKPNTRVVMLLAARPGSVWQQNAMRWATDILFLKKRLKFENRDGLADGHAPFDSVLLGYNVSLARMRDYGTLCKCL